MDRRGFLRRAAIMGAALLLNPVKLLGPSRFQGYHAANHAVVADEASGGFLVPKEYADVFIDMARDGQSHASTVIIDMKDFHLKQVFRFR